MILKNNVELSHLQSRYRYINNQVYEQLTEDTIRRIRFKHMLRPRKSGPYYAFKEHFIYYPLVFANPKTYDDVN